MTYKENRSCKTQSLREILESMAAQKDGVFCVLDQLVLKQQEGGIYECR